MTDDRVEQPVELTVGAKYPVRMLVFGGWEKDGMQIASGLPSFFWESFFSSANEYLGPDVEGVYPTFWL